MINRIVHVFAMNSKPHITHIHILKYFSRAAIIPFKDGGVKECDVATKKMSNSLNDGNTPDEGSDKSHGLQGKLHLLCIVMNLLLLK